MFIEKKFANPNLTKIFTLNDLKKEKINPRIYFSPLAFPYVNSFNFSKGCIFDHYVIPTSGYKFDDIWTKITPDLHLQDYKNWLFETIEKNILNLYKNKKQVNLLFSGGIDSLVTASYIVAHNLTEQTRFITVYDNVQKDNFALVNDSTARNLIQNFMNKFKVQDWLQINLDKNDFIDVCNTKRFENIRCHSTSAIFKKFDNEIFIGGHGGNWSLLHKEHILDELILKDPHLISRIDSILATKDLYCKTHKNYFYTGTAFNDIHFDRKKWDHLMHSNNNQLHLVMATSDIYDQTRRVDWNTVDVITICDAQVARQIINKNVGSNFDSFIKNENINDCDNFVSLNLDVEQLDSEIFSIPSNLNHHDDGLYWWDKELQSAKHTGYINSNTVASFLAMQQLSAEINNICENI